MVILGLERPVEYGSRQIFDPTMANMVLNAQNRYIQAMREDYLQGREDLKEFNKNFGDFFSPIQKDMEWYDQNVTGATRDLINNLYAQGMDMRNPEFRAAVSRFINSMPVGKINQLKQSAATANKYLENMGKLMAEGRYNPDAEKSFGRDLSTWDTLGGSGIWGASSPVENMTMDEIIEPIISNLDYTYDEARTKQANDGNDYYTVTEDRIRQTIADNMEDLVRPGTMPGYYYNLALKQTGNDPEKARALYTDWLTNRGKDHLKEKFEPNKFALMRQEHAYDVALENLKHKNDKDLIDYRNSHPGDDNKKENPLYNIPEDVYVTTLAKGAGIEHLPQGGITPEQLRQMLSSATKTQNAKIMQTRDVFSATGMFISPEKIASLVQSDGKNGNGYFLNSNYFKNLHDLQDVRTSYKGWLKTGSTKEQSKEIRANEKQKNKDMIAGIVKSAEENKKVGFRLKVVPVTDENGNNTYNMVGDDGRWHTYARVRVYMSDGKKDTKSAGNSHKEDKKTVYDIPKEGRDMALEVGLHSNKNAATPDLTVSAREELGFYGYDATSKKVGRNNNSGFPYGTNILRH